MANITLRGLEPLNNFLPAKRELEDSSPLDVRLIVENYSNLTDLVESKYAYPGMIVYVKTTKTHYAYKPPHWVDFGSASSVLAFCNLKAKAYVGNYNTDMNSLTEVVEFDETYTFEKGEAIKVISVTPEFTTSSTPITSIKIGTTEDGSDLYSGGPVESGTEITLTAPKSYTVENIGTIYCTISDGISTIRKNIPIKREYYTYYISASSDEPSTTANWATTGDGSIHDTDFEITSQAGGYIWIASPKTKRIAQRSIWEYNELSNTYASSMSTQRFDDKTIQNRRGYPCSGAYDFYCSSKPRARAGTSKFKLGE